MPYKRSGSPYYQVRRRKLPGYGDSGVLSSKVTAKKLARDMERCLEEIAIRALEDSSWYALLDAVCRQKTVSLPDLMKARNTGNLAGLKRSLSDPLLTEAITSFKQTAKYERSTGIGLRLLTELSPVGMRLGDLSSKRITKLCVIAERAGRKRNSVRRTLLRAISLLLRFHLGNAERDRIFSDVQFASENDTREVHLLPEDIGRLISACREYHYEELAVLIRIALQTSADRGVLLTGKNMGKKLRGLLKRDVTVYRDDQSKLYQGELFLSDTKTANRTRSVPLTDSLCREMLVLCKNKGPDEPVFSINYSQLDFLWKRVKKRADLDHVRFKDLRAQTAIYAEEAGVPQTVIQKTLGHSSEAMTRRYQQRHAALSQEQASAIEARMFGAQNERKIAKAS